MNIYNILHQKNIRKFLFTRTSQMSRLFMKIESCQYLFKIPTLIKCRMKVNFVFVLKHYKKWVTLIQSNPHIVI